MLDGVKGVPKPLVQRYRALFTSEHARSERKKMKDAPVECIPEHSIERLEVQINEPIQSSCKKSSRAKKKRARSGRTSLVL
jgi:hypothetical protein